MTDEPEKRDLAADEKAPSPGAEIERAGNLPAPARDGPAPPTPESQAALTGKAPSGSSSSGTTMPASSGDPSATASDETAAKTPNAPPPNETPEEKKARLARVIAEAKAKKEAAQAAGSGQPPGGASPATSDEEKAAKIAAAKAKAAALKTAAGAKPAPPQPSTAGAAAAGAPKPPVKKKEEGPAPVEASTHPLVKRLRERFDGAVEGATEFLGQLSIRIARGAIVEVCDALRRDTETPFDYLSDLTCVHYPDNFDAPFEVVYNLYSIGGNVRVRLKVATTDEEGVESVTRVWPTANWMEREVYDLFGVRFKNHPDLRRLLLPPDWEGHPLRKDYPLEAMENEWTAKHLPEFDVVQQEQIEQRRAYELELLSSPYERRVREIFRGGKEVMPKEHK